jgi:hypothetical protein
MQLYKLALFGFGAAVMAVAVSLLTLAGHPAAAATDLTGAWDANYSLACSASFTQTGSAVAGSVECGASLTVDVSGTFDAATGSLALSGTFSGAPVTIGATLSGDGHAMSGTWSAPPLVANGPFSAVRDGAPTTANVQGLWLINVRNLFAGHCRIQIDQAGSQLATTLNCDGGLNGTLNGTYNSSTGAVSLNGTLGSLGAFEMLVTVSDDGNSFNGIWRLSSGNGAAGIMDGERRPQKPCGDVNDNGRVDSVDATLILQYGAGLVPQLANAPSGDLNGDGSVNSIDATLVLQYAAALVSQLSC